MLPHTTVCSVTSPLCASSHPSQTMVSKHSESNMLNVYAAASDHWTRYAAPLKHSGYCFLNAIMLLFPPLSAKRESPVPSATSTTEGGQEDTTEVRRNREMAHHTQQHSTFHL